MDPELDSYSMESGYRMTKALLEEGVDCTAIFAISSSCELSNSKSFNLVGSPTLLLNSYTFLKSSSQVKD